MILDRVDANERKLQFSIVEDERGAQACQAVLAPDMQNVGKLDEDIRGYLWLQGYLAK